MTILDPAGAPLGHELSVSERGGLYDQVAPLVVP
jgi:hypothetical protein